MQDLTGQQNPPLVRRAQHLAVQMGFERSCSPGTGRLLRVLAAQVQDGVVAEIGTGCGVGSAWIASGLRPGVSFVTVEIDGRQASAVRDLLGSLPNVQIIEADWRAILAYGPFALLFADAAAAKHDAPEEMLTALRPGGVIVLDDLTPGRRDDPLRDFWLNNPRIVATEILVSLTEAVILATRLR